MLSAWEGCPVEIVRCGSGDCRGSLARGKSSTESEAQKRRLGTFRDDVATSPMKSFAYDT